MYLPVILSKSFYIPIYIFLYLKTVYIYIYIYLNLKLYPPIICLSIFVHLFENSLTIFTTISIYLFMSILRILPSTPRSSRCYMYTLSIHIILI